MRETCDPKACSTLTLSLPKPQEKVVQSCLTLCNPIDYTVHGILQARILEWVHFLFSRGSSQARDRSQVSHLAGGFFTSWATREAPKARGTMPNTQPVSHKCTSDSSLSTRRHEAENSAYSHLTMPFFHAKNSGKQTLITSTIGYFKAGNSVPKSAQNSKIKCRQNYLLPWNSIYGFCLWPCLINTTRWMIVVVRWGKEKKSAIRSDSLSSLSHDNTA